MSNFRITEEGLFQLYNPDTGLWVTPWVSGVAAGVSLGFSSSGTSDGTAVPIDPYNFPGGGEGSNFRVKENVFCLYNPDSGKWHRLEVWGADGKAQFQISKNGED